MTMCVLIRYRNTLIMAADKRSIWINELGEKTVISDNVNKIVPWRGGYITGSGSVEILDIVKSYVAENDISSVHDIEDFLTTTVRNGKFHDYWIKTTNIVAIYLSSGGVRAVIISAKDLKTFSLNDATVVILVPDTTVDDFKNKIEGKLKSNQFELFDIISDLKALFKIVSIENISVSSSFDLAVIDHNGMGLIHIEN